MKQIKSSIIYIVLMLFTLGFTACSGDSASSLALSGECWINSFSLNGISGTIDQTTKVITVHVPVGTDVTSMTPDYSISDGATASLAKNTPANFSLPITVKVTNGDVFLKYTISVVVDEAVLKSFSLSSKYIGLINETTKSVIVYVPIGTDLTNMVVAATFTDSATISPAVGSSVDFTNPVEFTISNNSAVSVYTVTVVPTNIQYTAFVGTAASVDALSDIEEKSAAEWLLSNVPGSEYISFADIVSGKVLLGKYKAIWWHCNTQDLPADALSAVSLMKSYYMGGGNLLLSRFATKYIAKLTVSKDEREPNNCWGDATSWATSGPWGISYVGHEDHALFQNLKTADGKTNIAYLIDKGYYTTNSTAQWHIGSDWGGYDNLDVWRETTGGIDLAGSDGDTGRGAVVIAEFEPRNGSGDVICIGTGSYDWYGENGTSDNTYRSNTEQLTKNAINYLSK